MTNHQATMTMTAIHTTPRARSALAICAVSAVAGSVLSLTMAAPIAHGDDPLDPIRAAVNNARSATPCPALNYSIELEGEAQASIHNSSPGVPPAGRYKGSVAIPQGSGDPESKAIDDAVGRASPIIRDCTRKDFGVGFVRIDQRNPPDEVAIAFGVPAAPAPAPAAPPAAQPKMATVVGGDANIYNIAHDENPDPNTGVTGMKIGTLQNGQRVALADGGPCTQNSWCKIVMPNDPAHFGFVLGHLQF
jgi:hypothetical protein